MNEFTCYVLFLSLFPLAFIGGGIFSAVHSSREYAALHNPTNQAEVNFCRDAESFCDDVCIRELNGKEPVVCFKDCPIQSAHLNSTHGGNLLSDCRKFMYLEERYCDVLSDCLSCISVKQDAHSGACKARTGSEYGIFVFLSIWLFICAIVIGLVIISKSRE